MERTNRKLRFDEKVRYKFRTQRSLERFVCLRLDRLAEQALSKESLTNKDFGPKGIPEITTNPGGD